MGGQRSPLGAQWGSRQGKKTGARILHWQTPCSPLPSPSPSTGRAAPSQTRTCPARAVRRSATRPALFRAAAAQRVTASWPWAAPPREAARCRRRCSWLLRRGEGGGGGRRRPGTGSAEAAARGGGQSRAPLLPSQPERQRSPPPTTGDEIRGKQKVRPCSGQVPNRSLTPTNAPVRDRRTTA